MMLVFFSLLLFFVTLPRFAILRHADVASPQRRYAAAATLLPCCCLRHYARRAIRATVS